MIQKPDLRILVLALLACWYMVSVVWRKEDWSPTTNNVSHFNCSARRLEMSVRCINDST